MSERCLGQVGQGVRKGEQCQYNKEKGNNKTCSRHKESDIPSNGKYLPDTKVITKTAGSPVAGQVAQENRSGSARRVGSAQRINELGGAKRNTSKKVTLKSDEGEDTLTNKKILQMFHYTLKAINSLEKKISALTPKQNPNENAKVGNDDDDDADNHNIEEEEEDEEEEEKSIMHAIGGEIKNIQKWIFFDEK